MHGLATNDCQVAYLMADISNVKYEQIKDITESLETLTCTFCGLSRTSALTLSPRSLHYDTCALLDCLARSLIQQHTEEY